LEFLKQESHSELKKYSLLLSHSIHEVLGVAQPRDLVIFVDDNIGSGTQFSAQMLRWCDAMSDSHNKHVRGEKGIELTPLDRNRRELFEGLEVWLATCVGATESEHGVLQNLRDSKINFGGLRYGQNVTNGNPPAGRLAKKRPPLIEFLRSVGKECVRHCRALPEITNDCLANSLGYENREGMTVTLWNVPTSTYTALWSPAIIGGEPWCPLFIRRGYVGNLIIA